MTFIQGEGLRVEKIAPFSVCSASLKWDELQYQIQPVGNSGTVSGKSGYFFCNLSQPLLRQNIHASNVFLKVHCLYVMCYITPCNFNTSTLSHWIFNIGQSRDYAPFTLYTYTGLLLGRPSIFSAVWMAPVYTPRPNPGRPNNEKDLLVVSLAYLNSMAFVTRDLEDLTPMWKRRSSQIKCSHFYLRKIFTALKWFKYFRRFHPHCRSNNMVALGKILPR